MGVGGYMLYSYRADNETARVGGESYGRGTDQQGCIDESLRQFRSFGENTYRVRLRQMHIAAFTNACLSTAAETKGFCEAVPPRTEYLKALEWTINKCKSAGVDPDGPCNAIFAEIEKKCPVKKPHIVSYPNTNAAK